MAFFYDRMDLFHAACADEGEAGRDLTTAKDNSPPLSILFSLCKEEFCRTKFTRRHIG